MMGRQCDFLATVGVYLGLSAVPAGDPSGVIKDTLEGLHYAEHCGDPDRTAPFPRLIPDGEQSN